MDVNDLRSAVTVFSMLVFVAIVWRTWSGRNQSNFDEAARLPFAEDGVNQQPNGGAQ